MSLNKIEPVELAEAILKTLLLYLARDNVRDQINCYLSSSKTPARDLMITTLIALLRSRGGTLQEISNILQIQEEALKDYIENYKQLTTIIEEILMNTSINIDDVLDEAILLTERVRILEHEVSKLRRELDRCINEKNLREKLGELEKIIQQLEKNLISNNSIPT